MGKGNWQRIESLVGDIPEGYRACLMSRDVRLAGVRWYRLVKSHHRQYAYALATTEGECCFWALCDFLESRGRVGGWGAFIGQGSLIDRIQIYLRRRDIPR